MISPSLIGAPNVGDWLDLSTDGVVTIRTGKVEIGQGILTALVQVASDAFALPADRIRVASGVTGVSPNESYTAGSLSVPHSATALEAACHTCVRHLRARAAERAGQSADSITLTGGRFTGPSLPEDLTLWSLAAEAGLDFEVEAPVGRPLLNRPEPGLPGSTCRRRSPAVA